MILRLLNQRQQKTKLLISQPPFLNRENSVSPTTELEHLLAAFTVCPSSSIELTDDGLVQVERRERRVAETEVEGRTDIFAFF